MLQKSYSRIRVFGLSAVFSLGCVFSVVCQAGHDVFAQNDRQYQLGMEVFSDYCSRCHGEHADGRGKAVPLYVNMKSALPSNFNVGVYSFRPKQYLAKIVRDGGKKHSLSEYMPPFGEELTNDQIDDVVYFIQNVSVHIVSKTHSAMQQARKEK
jgi:mono/diheme cytochrome c family protein